MAYRRARKQVTWTPAAAEQRARAKRPHPHITEVPLTPQHAGHVDSLLPGALWIVEVPLGPFKMAPGAYYEQHEIPYLTLPDWADAALVPIDTPAVYLGTTRVAEATPRGSVMSFLRHVFLIRGQRWMVADLNLLRPVTLPLNLSEDDAGMRDVAP